MPRIYCHLVLKYGTDVVPNSQTVVWLGLPVFCAQPGTVVCSKTPVVSRLSERGRRGDCRLSVTNKVDIKIFIHLFHYANYETRYNKH